jgi:YegS/Rv2252/BmrU family lipid kinase
MTGPVVVFNPVSGLDADEVRAALAAAGLTGIRWVETTKDDPGVTASRAAVDDAASLVIACGGDGTVMACVTGLAGSDVPLAVVPAGTGNLLARNFAIDRSLAGAATIAAIGVRRRIDVGVLGDERFAVMAGIGFDAQMLRDAPRELKDKVGWLAYVISGVRTARRSPRATFRLTLDDGRVVRRRGRGVLVGNVGDLQAGLPVLPGAVPDDGAFEIGVLAARSARDWLGLLVRLVLRSTPRERQLEVFTSSRVDVTVDRDLPLQLDGDVRRPTRHFVAEIQPRALTLCVPADEKAPAEDQREESVATSEGSSGSTPSAVM